MVSPSPAGHGYAHGRHQWVITDHKDGSLRGSYVPVAATLEDRTAVARQQGYTGDCCTNCSMFTTRRNGSCLVCDSCGTTTGCS